MPWAVLLERRAEKDLDKLSGRDRERIVRFLHDRLAVCENPRDLGEALAGSLSGFWKCRVGDYRILARIEDRRVTILVVRIGSRCEVYR